MNYNQSIVKNLLKSMLRRESLVDVVIPAGNSWDMVCVMSFNFLSVCLCCKRKMAGKVYTKLSRDMDQPSNANKVKVRQGSHLPGKSGSWFGHGTLLVVKENFIYQQCFSAVTVYDLLHFSTEARSLPVWVSPRCYRMQNMSQNNFECG